MSQSGATYYRHDLARLLVALAGAEALRLVVALWSVRTGHPDEVFQYLEQAHRLVYGFGYVPWEYRFGVRNLLLPEALAGLLATLRSLHIDQPTLYVPLINCATAVLSGSVVWATYQLGSQLLGEQVARLATAVAAVWYDLLYFSTIATPEVLGGYAIFTAFALSTLTPRHKIALSIGLLLGVGVALRPQYGLAAAAVWIYTGFRWGWHFLVPVGISGLVIPALAGILDSIFWGAPFISYYNYILFNLIYGVSGNWGRSPLFWYVVLLASYSAGLYPVAVVYGATVSRRCWPILLLIACVLLPQSLVSHKEYRFIFLAIPLILLLLSDLIWAAICRMPVSIKRSQALNWAVASAIVVSLAGATLEHVFRRDDHLLAALALSQQKRVEAVIDLTVPWFDSGGYYYFHQNVPLYFDGSLEYVAPADFHLFASHILVRATHPRIPGFRVSSAHGDIMILEQISPPNEYRLIKDYDRPKEPAVDNQFTPNIHTGLFTRIYGKAS